MFRRVSFYEWVAIAALAIAGIVWAVRLEGRVNTQDREIAAVQRQHREAVGQFREDLTYIRRRLDEALDRGGLR